MLNVEECACVCPEVLHCVAPQTMSRHTCECECPADAPLPDECVLPKVRFCFQSFFIFVGTDEAKVYNGTACDCECEKVQCPEGQAQSTDTCHCECVSVSCPPRKKQSQESCQCECDASILPECKAPQVLMDDCL